MASSSNTFGTFLNTFNTLERQSSFQETAPGAPSADFLINIASLISASGAEKSLSEIAVSFSGQASAVLSAVLVGQKLGLFELQETNEGPRIRLTALGIDFVKNSV